MIYPPANEQNDPASGWGWKISFHSKWVIFRVYVNLPEDNGSTVDVVIRIITEMLMFWHSQALLEAPYGKQRNPYARGRKLIWYGLMFFLLFSLFLQNQFSLLYMGS